MLDVVLFDEMGNFGWVVVCALLATAVDGAIHEEFDFLLDCFVDQGFTLYFFGIVTDGCLFIHSQHYEVFSW